MPRSPLRPQRSSEPPGTNEPRTVPFAVHRKLSKNFDRDARKYDKPLDASLMITVCVGEHDETIFLRRLDLPTDRPVNSWRMKLEADLRSRSNTTVSEMVPGIHNSFSHSRVHSLRHGPPAAPPGPCHPSVILEGMFFLGIHPDAIHAQLRHFFPRRFHLGLVSQRNSRVTSQRRRGHVLRLHPSSTSKLVRDLVRPLRLLNACQFNKRVLRSFSRYC